MRTVQQEEQAGAFAEALASPGLRIAMVCLGVALVVPIAREVRRIPTKLAALMVTAFVDMVGLFFVVPILPFYVQRLVGDGVDFAGVRFEKGTVTAIVIAAFTAAQLLAAPFWGRFSDRFGRRPALLIALASSAVAYVVFGFAESVVVLMASRVVQGAGGGTVGVIQAYVADSVEPELRTRALGWLSAATNLGVALGPVFGAFMVQLGNTDLQPGEGIWRMGAAAPGLGAAALCLLNMAFAALFLRESNTRRQPAGAPGATTARGAVWSVVAHPGRPPSRLILVYAIAIGAFQGINAVLALFLGKRFQVDEASIGYVFMYIGAISVFARVLLLGRLLDRLGEVRLSRLGIVILASGLYAMTVADSLPLLAVAIGLMPLGTAFTFPCVSALLSRVVAPEERGLWLSLQQTYGGVSRLLMPLFYGWAFDTLGENVPFEVAAGLVATTLALSVGFGALTRGTAATAPTERRL